MARKPLGANVRKPDADKATEVARKLAGGGQSEDPDVSGLTETVSYVLPVEMIEELTELASLRLRRDKKERRAAKLAGERPQGQARRSASAIVREAIEAHREKIRAETTELRKELGID